MAVGTNDAKEMAGTMKDGLAKTKVQLLGIGLLIFLLFWVIRTDKYQYA